MPKIDYFNSEHYPDPTAYYGQINIEKEKRKKAYRPLVYICSPYAGEIEKNLKFAKRCCRFAVNNHYIPLATHLLYPQFLKDETPEERELALFFGLVMISHCDELWICGTEISKGMKGEIQKAKKRRMTIRYIQEIDGKLQEVQKSGRI